MTPADTAAAIWRAGVAAVDGTAAVEAALPSVARPDHVLAVGKAAAAMTRPVLTRWPGTPVTLVTKDGHAGDLPMHVAVYEAAHPVPDARSLTAGQALLDATAHLPPSAHVLVLVSGGASSLAEALAEGWTLDDLSALNRKLLGSGLDIAAMNAERRKISRVKGGGLLSVFGGARATILSISDVPGDALSVIGSGIGMPPADARFETDCRCVASNVVARAASARAAEAMGLAVHIQTEALHDDLPRLTATLAAQVDALPKGVAIWGGEPTVTLPADPGRGGRNQALALALAEHIAGRSDIIILVAGTDGTDGPTEAAGAIVDGRTWGVGAAAALHAADSGTYLHKHDALFVTGPTGTNVMDLAVALRF